MNRDYFRALADAVVSDVVSTSIIKEIRTICEETLAVDPDNDLAKKIIARLDEDDTE